MSALNEDTGWIGVDLDGTLAMYDTWKGPDHVGEPIPAMVERVKAWLAEGREVRIFTARVSHDGSRKRLVEANISRLAIQNFCVQNFGRALQITNEKDYRMTELWDDRAVQVEANTGRVVGYSTRGNA